jgi:hypothetical protein
MNFFHALMPQRAFWYLALLPMEQYHIERVRLCFPSLSQLMNIGEAMLCKVLLECKLLQKKSKAAGTWFLSLSWNSWDSFIKEYGLNIEWIQVKVNGKQHFFLHLGSWNKSWPSITPRVVLRQDNCEPLLLRISRTIMFVAATISKLELSAVSDPFAAIATPLSVDATSNGSSASTESDTESYTESVAEEKVIAV